MGVLIDREASGMVRDMIFRMYGRTGVATDVCPKNKKQVLERVVVEVVECR